LALASDLTARSIGIPSKHATIRLNGGASLLITPVHFPSFFHLQTGLIENQLGAWERCQIAMALAAGINFVDFGPPRKLPDLADKVPTPTDVVPDFRAEVALRSGGIRFNATAGYSFEKSAAAMTTN